MSTREFKNGFELWGWVVAAAAALVAFGALVVVGKFAFMPAGYISAMVFAVVGIILGMPWGDAKASKPAVAVVKPTVAAAPTVAAPAVQAAVPPVAQPLMASAAPAVKTDAEAAAPAAVMAAPVMAQPVAVAAEPVALTSVDAAPKPARAKAKAKDVATPVTPADAVVDAPVAAKPQAARKTAKVDGPVRLSAPRGGKADDLKEIEGIGPALEKLCHELGFYHFDQVAGWSDADVAWVDQNMARFKGRIVRDRWVAQARIIVTEGLDAFRERAKTNNY